MARLIAIPLLFALAGCTTHSVELKSYTGAPPGQQYEIDAVIERAKQLKPGMVALDVLFTLGSPAERHGDYWLYLPSDPGLVVPKRAMVVKFRGNRYVSHQTQLILLGERIAFE